MLWAGLFSRPGDVAAVETPPDDLLPAPRLAEDGVPAEEAERSGSRSVRSRYRRGGRSRPSRGSPPPGCNGWLAEAEVSSVISRTEVLGRTQDQRTQRL